MAQAVRQVEAMNGSSAIADESMNARNKLPEILEQHPTQSKQVHNADIVATMLVYKINTLRTPQRERHNLTE
ncbi:MAG: hypothetical protein NZ750_00155 [Anaerolineae bacterium]|nr:hypothetical protein [Anaerolineae bacterium]MDW8171965.1 hypothetical protein [Anaerolineae bacterium]